MPLILSSSLVLAPATASGINENNPLIGWHNLVTRDNISADEETVGYPVTNLANPYTSIGASWLASTIAAHTITVLVNTEEQIDYLGVARHNYGTAAIAVQVEGRTEPGGDWTVLAGPAIPADDRPLLFRWTPGSFYEVRLVMAEGDAAPRAAVVYVGKLLVLPFRLFVGHTPITLGRDVTVITAVSENGAFLGSNVIGEGRSTSIVLRHLDEDWYYAVFDKFIAARRSSPWFWAWRPGDHPDGVGYVWLTADAKPDNELPNKTVGMGITLQIAGIA